VRGIAFSVVQSDDVVRHPLVARIVTAYEAYEQDAAARAPRGERGG
jgi:phosphate starvation-inducible protein PhoH